MNNFLILKGRWLIDGNSDKAILNPVIVIKDRRIAEVGEETRVTVPSDAEIIEAEGCSFMPAMMDTHVHMAAPNAQDYTSTNLARVIRSPAEILLDAANHARLLLEAGFTTVRDHDSIIAEGRNFCSEMASLRDAIAAGKLPGPRLIVGAFTHITGSHFDRTIPRNIQRDPTCLGDGPWGIRRLVRLNLRNGADFIKTCVAGGTGNWAPEDIHDRNITIDELKALVDEAHGWQKPVAAHCHTPESVRMALEAGVDTIEHCVLTDDDAVERLAASGKYVVPTLAFRDTSVIEARRARGVDEFVLRQMRESHEFARQTFQRYHEAGVKIAMGTDTHIDPPFGANALELEIYVNYGLSEIEAIQTATRDAADMLGLGNELGTIEKGKLADLIAVEGNPIEDISLLRQRQKIKVVVKEGNVAIDRR